MPEKKFEPLQRMVKAAALNQGASAWHVLLWQSGRTLLEDWGGTGLGDQGFGAITRPARFNVYSIRKVYIGLMAAWLMEETTVIGIDDPVKPFIQAPRFADVPGDVTVRHLVTHTHGLGTRGGASGHAYAEFPAGTRWVYNNTGVELLAHLIECWSGQSVAALVGQRVLDALGCRGTRWESTALPDLVRDVHDAGVPRQLDLGPPTGTERNLYVTAEDLLRFAALHLRHGRLRGRAVVPPTVINTVLAHWSPLNRGDVAQHGFFWWLPSTGFTEIGHRVPSDAYQIVGMNGSLCLVVPSLDAVLVRLMNRRRTVPSPQRLAEYHALGNAMVGALDG